MIKHLVVLFGHIVAPQKHVVVVDQDVDVAACVRLVEWIRGLLRSNGGDKLVDKALHDLTHELSRPQR